MPAVIPFVAAAASAAAGAATAGVLGTAITVLGVATTVGKLVAIGLSLAAAVLSTALQSKPKATEAQSQARIGGVTSAPPYRYIYGRVRIGGYRVFSHVKGNKLFLCYLLNSRPSDSIESIEFDSRRIEWANDSGNNIYDMSRGAAITTAPFNGLVRTWIGRGNQTTPPDAILSEISNQDILANSDAWNGNTVLWVSLDYGASASARERWISTPPDIRVTGKWSKVYDPRDSDQLSTDPNTWKYRSNAALIALDLARDKRGLNRMDNLINFDSFSSGADVCNERVPLKAGGTERRYRIGGVVEMGGQESAKMESVLDVAAAKLVDVSGKLTYIPGVWQDPDLTLTDVVGAHMEYSDLSTDTPNTVRTSVIAESRSWQETEIPLLQDPIALSNDAFIVREARLDLPLCPSPTQAMRLQRIALRRARLERSLTAEFPPHAYAAHAGGVVAVDLDGFQPANGFYTVDRLEPRFQESGSGISMTIGLTLMEASPDVYEWNADDESDFPSSDDIDNTPTPLASPGPLTIVSDTRNLGGGVYIPQAVITFLSSDSAAVIAYNVQRKTVDGVWQNVATINADTDTETGYSYVEVEGVSFGETYDFQVFAIASDGRRSSPSIELGVTISPPSASVQSPTLWRSSNNGGNIEVIYRTPSDSEVTRITIYGGDTSNTDSMVSLFDVASAPNQLFGTSETVPTTHTRYYAAKCFNAWGNESEWSDITQV